MNIFTIILCQLVLLASFDVTIWAIESWRLVNAAVSLRIGTMDPCQLYEKNVQLKKGEGNNYHLVSSDGADENFAIGELYAVNGNVVYIKMVENNMYVRMIFSSVPPIQMLDHSAIGTGMQYTLRGELGFSRATKFSANCVALNSVQSGRIRMYQLETDAGPTVFYRFVICHGYDDAIVALFNTSDFAIEVKEETYNPSIMFGIQFPGQIGNNIVYWGIQPDIALLETSSTIIPRLEENSGTGVGDSSVLRSLIAAFEPR